MSINFGFGDMHVAGTGSFKMPDPIELNPDVEVGDYVSFEYGGATHTGMVASKSGNVVEIYAMDGSDIMTKIEI